MKLITEISKSFPSRSTSPSALTAITTLRMVEFILFAGLRLFLDGLIHSSKTAFELDLVFVEISQS